ncbi:hypothetical protein HC251_25220 (plasmid) [Iamia sp. SCSIO 61187]|uniref:hypothetical protein n=1 Tax=Iamia sp. SCSIO 61187 TaxID=2722752 RepID=UPI001C62958B|nr:hypothetical protein [Iamia sp. SCSIO 61187]QYG95852.1 hypothetical protein HC251_25220 [Iamia sp. SCSIO 61187]
MKRLVTLVAIVAATLLACSEDRDEPQDASSEATEAAPESTSTEADTTTARRSTTTTASSTTTTTEAPFPVAPPEAASSVGELCRFIEGFEVASGGSATLLWVNVAAPPNGGQLTLVVGFSKHPPGPGPAEAQALAKLLPFARAAIAVRPDIVEFVPIVSGTSFEAARKTLWEIPRADLEGYDLQNPEGFASGLPTAEWTQGRLPLTYLFPDPSRLDADGRFIEGSPCVG